MNYAKVKEYIKANEGFVPHGYLDSLGVLTIGYGRMIDKAKGGGITKDEADLLLENDIAGTLAELDRLVSFWRELPEPAQEAVVDMAFNMGAVNFVTGWPQTWAAIERWDWETVAANIAGSQYARQVGDGPGGRFDRADKNIDLFLSSPDMPTHQPAPQPTPKGLDDPALGEDAESWFDEIEWRPWRW